MKGFSPLKIMWILMVSVLLLHKPSDALAVVQEIRLSTAMPSNWFTTNTAALPKGMSQHAFISPSNRADVGYSVYLPPGYTTNTTKRYPVVYWLHGAGGNEIMASWLAELVDPAISAKTIPPMIIVFPNAGGRSMWCNSFDRSMLAETMVINELIPLIDSKYRTIKNRSGRFLQGFSMGGFGSARFLFKYPQMFSSAITYGAPYNTKTSIVGTAEYTTAFGNNINYFTANSPYTLANGYSKRTDKNLYPVRIRVVAGTDDPQLNLSTLYKNVLIQLKISTQYLEVAAVAHDSQAYYDAIGIDGFNFH